MEAKLAKSHRLDILGNEERSDREIFSSVLKQWRQRLSICSVLAAIPAMLTSQVSAARAEEARRPEASIAEQGMRPQRVKFNCSTPALLKRQSAYLLPHQKGSFKMLAAFAGLDDCPGRAIPGGVYTAAAPYVDTGDTTGANSTINSLRYHSYYYYYSQAALGPDHVYSFMLTGIGLNPEIVVTTPSSTYRPLIYVLHGLTPNSCPAGVANSEFNALALAGSNGIAAAINMSDLPLNAYLYLFIDSSRNDATGSGPYTLRIKDAAIAPATLCGTSNPIDCSDGFVRQHYLDLLGRQPDPLAAEWVRIINSCAPGDISCDRIHVSEAFFKSPEFQERGYFIYRFYPVAFSRKPSFIEFMTNLSRMSGFLTPSELEAAKVEYANDFTRDGTFRSIYDPLSNQGYVDRLISNAGVSLPNRQALIDGLNNGSLSRAQVLRQIVERLEVHQRLFNQAFVVMQYFGYLRRDPDALYLNWIAVLDANPADSRHMIAGFVNSIEYRQRFGPP